MDDQGYCKNDTVKIIVEGIRMELQEIVAAIVRPIAT